jgi:hypothetical protein
VSAASRTAVIVLVLLAFAALATVVIWVSSERPAPPAAPASDSTALEDEVKRLRRENAELREKLDRRPRQRAEPQPQPRETAPEAGAEAVPVPPPVGLSLRGGAVAQGAGGAADALDAVPLADLLEKLRSAAGKGDAAAMQAIETALARRGAAAVDPLLDLVRDTSASAGLRDAALRALSHLDAAGLAAVVENLYLGARNDPAMTPARRALATSAAVKADPQAAVAVVQRLLWSNDAADRAAALAGLSSARDAAFLPMLREEAMRPESAGVSAGLSDAIAVIRGARWSAFQATGAPDTAVAGDIGAAWASKQADMGEVWLELDFEVAVTPQSLRIRETYNPGAVARIEAVLDGGTRETLWEGRADVAAAPRWFEPALRTASRPVRTIRIVLDTDRVSGWNEIDAVELAGDGRRQWASAARASSSYSDP